VGAQYILAQDATASRLSFESLTCLGPSSRYPVHAVASVDSSSSRLDQYYNDTNDNNLLASVVEDSLVLGHGVRYDRLILHSVSNRNHATNENCLIKVCVCV